ncbi:uncharacterized protein LOC142235712 [Haematobia irritans]|uniref:uncharacterized protein LOC142235712 n=1 Tax=Haematobia irritans TaxID=7368 RepID=UPI003F5076EC
MFKFILLTIFVLGPTIHTILANGQTYDYDETANIVEMAFDAAETADDGNANVNDMDEDGTGYVYNEGDLENNINIAVNAAILDKYGQAVTSELSDQEAGDKQATKVEENDKGVKANGIENNDYFADKSETSIQQVENPKVGEERSLKSSDFKASPSTSSTSSSSPSFSSTANNVANAAEKKPSKPLATPVKNAQYNDNDTTPLNGCGNHVQTCFFCACITRFVSQVNADGTYGFDFAQSSGLEFKEIGQGGVFAEGSYQYVSPEGEHISVTYSADETGFHPESDILPTPPPIPAYILKALDYIRDHPTAEELADRQVRAKQI